MILVKDDFLFVNRAQLTISTLAKAFPYDFNWWPILWNLFCRKNLKSISDQDVFIFDLNIPGNLQRYTPVWKFLWRRIYIYIYIYTHKRVYIYIYTPLLLASFLTSPNWNWSADCLEVARRSIASTLPHAFGSSCTLVQPPAD